MVDALKKYTSLISIVFFVGAVWYEFLFYKGFGIDIFSYVSFGEIITLFIGNIPVLIGLCFLVILYVLMLKSLFSNFIERSVTNEKLRYKRPKRLNIRVIRRLLFLCSIFLLVVFGPMIVFDQMTSKKIIESVGYLFIRAIATFIIVFLTFVPLLASTSSISVEKLFISLFTVIFFLDIYYLASYDLWAVKFNRPTRVSIILKDSVIINTSDTVKYIGKTNSSIFLYYDNQILSPHITIIPTEDIKRINIETRLNWLRLP